VGEGDARGQGRDGKGNGQKGSEHWLYFSCRCDDPAGRSVSFKDTLKIRTFKQKHAEVRVGGQLGGR
jgi:hypothetical protein